MKYSFFPCTISVRVEPSEEGREEGCFCAKAVGRNTARSIPCLYLVDLLPLFLHLCPASFQSLYSLPNPHTSHRTTPTCVQY